MTSRRGDRSVLTGLQWICLLVGVEIRSAVGQALPGHSIETSADIKALDLNWYLAGTATPTKAGLVLNSGVQDRLGAIWSRWPLLTTSFEATITLRAKRSSPPANGAGLAFWYTPENGTKAHESLFFDNAQIEDKLIHKTWSQAFSNQGFDLFGYRNNFNGLGVFFTDSQTPSVSAITNNGIKTLRMNTDVPSPDAIKFDWASNNIVTVKITISPDKAKIEVVGGGSVEVKSTFSSQAYIGLTAHGGDNSAAQSSTHIELVSLSVVNLDTKAQGEEAHTTMAPAPGAVEEKIDPLAETSSFKDHRLESDAIKALTHSIFKLVVETGPLRSQMAHAIETLSTRIDAMELSFKDLKKELDKKTGHNLGEEFEQIKQELTGLSSAASKESMDRHNKLETLHADITHVHRTASSPDSIDHHLNTLSESNSKILDQLTNEHQKMFGVSVAAILFIVIAGLALYNKFHCWDKKHVL